MTDRIAYRHDPRRREAVEADLLRGVPPGAAARQHGLSRNTVKDWAARLGLRWMAVPAEPAPVTLADIAPVETQIEACIAERARLWALPYRMPKHLRAIQRLTDGIATLEDTRRRLLAAYRSRGARP